MAEIYLRRTLAGLAPADDEAGTALRKIPVGSVVKADVRRPRSLQQHRRYWLLCSLVAENHEQLQTRDQVHDVLKLLTGLYTVVALKSTGEVLRVPRSISFGEMSQEDFDDYYRRACDAVVEHLLPGVQLNEVREEVLRLVA